MEAFLEMMLFANLLNLLFKSGTRKFDELPRIFADQMMVPSVAVNVLIMRMNILIPYFLHKSRLGHEIQRAIDGSATHVIDP